MLAGNMKLKHFLALVGLGGAGLAGGTGWWWSNRPPPPPPAEAAAVVPAADAATPAATAEAHVAQALSYAGRDLGTDKLKDASAGRPYKINVYQDAGQPTANRLKVDLDRDERWDEKWTFEPGGGVLRQVASADDEVYDRELRWDGSAWRGPGEDAASSAADPPTSEAGSAEAGAAGATAGAAADPLAALPTYERVALSWAGRSISGDKLKDATKGESYKINVYQDEGRTAANRLKVDVDRDDKWDEKWTFHDDGTISREIAPNDDEQYTARQVWTGGAWQDGG